MPKHRKAATPPKETAQTNQKTCNYNNIARTGTQAEMMLHALHRTYVTTADAVYRHGILRPASAVHRLRTRGYNIVTVMCWATLPDARMCRCAEYHLLQDGASVSDLLGRMVEQ